MAKIFYASDCNLGLLDGKPLQSSVTAVRDMHALNLHRKRRRCNCRLYEGSKSWPKAEAAGLKVATVSEAAKAADIVMILLPDEKQKDIYDAQIKEYMTEGKVLAFAHGFNIHFEQIKPPAGVDVIMVCSKRSGTHRPF